MSSENEEQYFLNALADQRRAIRHALDQSAQEEAQRRALATTLSLRDEDLLTRIRALGFDGDTGRIFDLLPLIYVAWADGRVQYAEYKMIFDILRMREIEPGSEAWLFTEALLEKSPSPEYMKLTLELLQALHNSTGNSATSVIEFAAQIAATAGGLFGLAATISPREREMINDIAQRFGLDDTAVRTLLT